MNNHVAWQIWRLYMYKIIFFFLRLIKNIWDKPFPLVVRLCVYAVNKHHYLIIYNSDIYCFDIRPSFRSRRIVATMEPRLDKTEIKS